MVQTLEASAYRTSLAKSMACSAVERLDGENRAERLLLDDRIVDASGDDGRLDEEALVTPTLSAGHHGGVRGRFSSFLVTAVKWLTLFIGP